MSEYLIDTNDRDSKELLDLLAPRSIALVGVSEHPNAINARTLEYLQRYHYSGTIYLINQRAPTINGISSYRSLKDIGSPVDLVISLVPARHVLDVANDAITIGAKCLVIFASGFSEIGSEGRQLQNALAEVAMKSRLRIIGPNSQGFVFSPARAWATFTTAADRPMSDRDDFGGAYVGQSGAIGGVILDRLSEVGLSLVAWVSTGNEVDLTAIDLACALLSDRRVKYIILYIENVHDHAQFAKLAIKSAQLHKPLVILRSGDSAAGRRATSSHTGAMIGSSITIHATARRYQLPIAEDIAQSVTLAALLSRYERLKGRRLGVVTSSGGAGGIFADIADKYKFTIPEPENSTKDILRKLIPAFGSINNPVDVTAQLFATENDAMVEVIDALVNDSNFDAIVIILTNVTGLSAIHLATVIAAYMKEARKPVYVSWLIGHNATAEARAIFKQEGILVIDSLANLIRALDKIACDADQRQISSEFNTTHILNESGKIDRRLDIERARLAINEDDAATLLDSLRIRQPKTHLVANLEALDELIQRLPDQPVVMKLLAPSVHHKTEIGGVRLNVSRSDIRKTFGELQDVARRKHIADLRGIQIQEQTLNELELMITAMRENQGSPCIACVGHGGVATEVYKDIVYQLGPIVETDVYAMLRKLSIWPLLDGYRGATKYDIKSVAAALVNLTDGFSRMPISTSAIEINPLIVLPEGQGVMAVDCLILKDERTETRY